MENTGNNGKVPGPIGIFDSGYGGLTVFQKIREALPHCDFIYLGDNARAPYGPRSFDIVYDFTRQAVFKLFEMGCPLVILACNTASAKALRTIQQQDLPRSDDPTRRVLGVIRPTVEVLDRLSRSKHVGILGTSGTIASCSYTLEIAKLFPHIRVTEEACPLWVPLVENREADSPGADYFIRKNIDAIFATSTPPTQGVLCAMVAKRLSKKYKRKVPIVYNLQDVFPDSLVTTGLAKKGSLLWKVGRKIENYTYIHADKIIVLSHGEIIEMGNHQELLKAKGHYYNLYNIQLDKDRLSK